jgi:hypothetical protein
VEVNTEELKILQPDLNLLLIIFSLNNILKNQYLPHRKHITSALNGNWLMLFKEIITVYSKNHKKIENTPSFYHSSTSVHASSQILVYHFLVISP